MARALLRRPQLLLLDEVTSQLDAVNELALRGTITRVKEHYTLVVVAHRLSTVRTADQIVVMEAGRGPLRRRRGSSGRASHLTRRERLRLVI